MNAEIIKLLSEHIEGKHSSHNISSETMQFAKSHEVAAIIYFQTKESCLYHSYLQTISAYSIREALLKQIAEMFIDIPFYVVKGTSVAQYYPVPQLRTMGDSDIVVHECDKERAKHLLLSNGFVECTGEWDDKEWHFRKQGMDFELHHRLLYDETGNSDQEKTFSDSAWYYVQDSKLDNSFHFVFLLLHLKKHLINCGAGIRQFMDLAAMSKNAGLEPDRVKTFLQLAGIEQFAGVCSALCLRWFGVSLPVHTPEISDKFYESATEMILSNGVFGFNVPENMNNRFLYDVEKLGKVGSILSYLFPSYKICCITPKYKWVKGKPYLLPCLWVYRFFCSLSDGKRKDGEYYISTIVKKDEAMKERNRILTTWGL